MDFLVFDDQISWFFFHKFLGAADISLETSENLGRKHGKIDGFPSGYDCYIAMV